jgi:predicted nicotinamide N-methyase
MHPLAAVALPGQPVKYVIFVLNAGQAFHAVQVLSSYITFRGTGYLRGKRIVELGSGTGLVGLVAGALGGTVWITDQAFVSVLSLIQLSQ